ncbi:hypothetical protein D9M72_622610 [compost metagenome]
MRSGTGWMSTSLFVPRSLATVNVGWTSQRMAALSRASAAVMEGSRYGISSATIATMLASVSLSTPMTALPGPRVAASERWYSARFRSDSAV